MVRIAILEASHWHVPLYLDGFSAPDIDVVAVSDLTENAGRALASRYGAKFYRTVDELLDKECIDFAFAFGRHRDLPRIANRLVEARTPFSIEKPCGLSVPDVAGLLASAQAIGLYVAVPYIYRVSELCRIIGELEGGLPSNFTHLSFRFIAGAPRRYEAWDCAWMLDPAESGGGALINVGGHFLDLFLLLTGKPVTRVSAVMSAATHGTSVEDFAAVTLQTGDGVVGVVEAGYTYPGAPGEQREFSFTARSKTHYLRSCDQGLAIREVAGDSGDARTINFERETDLYYPIFARRVLTEWRQGQAPSIGLREALEVMKILAAAYESARQGGAPVAIT
ncbi:MAG: Gfo/Idh/MocA family protein [Hyphomicrobiaceae bacterium]